MNKVFCGVATIALLAGCGRGAEGGQSGSLDSPDSPVARYDWDGGAAMQALLEGTLEMRDGCLVVRPSWDDVAADTYVLPAFPRTYTSWDGARDVLTYNGEDYRMGDQIAAGGGWVTPTEGTVIPPTCELDAGGDVMLIQDTSLATMADRGY